MKIKIVIAIITEKITSTIDLYCCFIDFGKGKGILSFLNHLSLKNRIIPKLKIAPISVIMQYLQIASKTKNWIIRK